MYSAKLERPSWVIMEQTYVFSLRNEEKDSSAEAGNLDALKKHWKTLFNFQKPSVHMM